MSKIKQLSPATISRISAGEVVERPSAAIKELVENSIDAGAKNIDVTIHAGGRNLIIIQDDGRGMEEDDLLLCVERHTTSKLNEEDIFDINFMGFRGEAIASIASISKFKITTKTAQSPHAICLEVQGGAKGEVQPANLPNGTKIEVRDLFYTTPARLKFLKSEQTEQQHITDIIKKLALSHPAINFSLRNETRQILSYQLALTSDPLRDRIAQVLGSDFSDNATYFEKTYANIVIKGFAAIPTFNKATSSDQYIFVNNRPIRDKVIYSAAKAAYADYIADNRYPALILFLELPKEEVDVNVHPSKLEVRFKDSSSLRGMIISAIKEALNQDSHKTSTTIATKAIEIMASKNYNFSAPAYNPGRMNDNIARQSFATMPQSNSTLDLRSQPQVRPTMQVSDELQSLPTQDQHYLGAPICQIDATYIVAQTPNSIVIIDQHAAHERLVYEQMKNEFAKEKLQTQRLLLPEVVELSSEHFQLITEIKQHLEQYGIIYNIFGTNSVLVTELPAILKDENPKNLLESIIHDISEHGQDLSISKKIEHIIETKACHGSIRAGKQMSQAEMEGLLRKMEQTPFSGQCNHGRPTYIELKFSDLEKLFQR